MFTELLRFVLLDTMIGLSAIKRPKPGLTELGVLATPPPRPRLFLLEADSTHEFVIDMRRHKLRKIWSFA